MGEHDIGVEAIGDGVWTASCSCGWLGEDWEDADDALLDGDDHRGEVSDE
jgi:hypothetical protein